MSNNLLKYLFVIALLAGITNRGTSQIQIIFQPALYGKTLSGIMHFQISNNASVGFSASVKIVVSGQPGGKMAEIVLPRIYINQGVNMMSETFLANAAISFGTSANAAIFKQTGKLNEGDYEYCYELNVLDDKPAIPLDYYENCFQLSLQPITPLLLTDPVDRDTICNLKPAFSWQSPLPVDINARYRVMVAEIKEKQTPVEALSFNSLAVNQPDIPSAYLTFPPAFKELEKGKTYAWQVYYSVNGRLLLKSEIWTFKVQCEETTNAIIDDSYRELKPDVEGDYYVARRKLRFALTNHYNSGVLKYKIQQLDNSGRKVKHLPVLKLTMGFNAYEIDLSEYREFEDDRAYKLEAELPNGQKYYLRFTYKD